jgi:hypothetical protein
LPSTKSRKPQAAKKDDTGIDQGLVKAVSHPDRLWALTVLNKRVASPNELARERRVDVNYIAYHVRVLAKCDCIELVKTEQRRGATEHFYRAKKRAHFDKSEWLRIPQTLREDTLLRSLTIMGEDVARSAEQGKFEGRTDRHFSHSAGAVDQQGWGDLQRLLDDTYEAYQRIQVESQERIAESDEPLIPVAVTMMGFERGD